MVNQNLIYRKGIRDIVMHIIKKFSVKNKPFSQYILGKKIVDLHFEVNSPIEKDCMKIVLENQTEILIYSFMRILANQRLLFSIADCWLENKDFDNICELKKQLIGFQVQSIKFNKIGDFTLLIENGTKIQSVIDTTLGETDYIRIEKEQEYYILCRLNNELITIIGNE